MIRAKQRNKKRHGWGAYYGYPECCVREFRASLGLLFADPLRSEMTEGGFVPCSEHAMKLLLGAVKRKNLIRDRRCPHPFPRSR